MTTAYGMTQADLIADLEGRILEYLRTRKANRTSAADLVRAIRKQHEFISTTPIVTAIWDLNAKSQIYIDGKWNVTLRQTDNATSQSG